MAVRPFNKRFARQFRIAVKQSAYAGDLNKLAGDAGCQKRNIDTYMTGTELPRVERLYRLADALGVSADFFNAHK